MSRKNRTAAAHPTSAGDMWFNTPPSNGQSQTAGSEAPATPTTPPVPPAPDTDTRHKKTVCPVTREEFREKAGAVHVSIGGGIVEADVKEFSTGSFGWFMNGKASILISGKPVRVPVSGSITVIGSKELPK